MVLFTSNFKVTASKKKRSADAQSSRFTNLTHNHTYSYSRGGKITTKHVTFKNAIMTPPGKMLFCSLSKSEIELRFLQVVFGSYVA